MFFLLFVNINIIEPLCVRHSQTKRPILHKYSSYSRTRQANILVGASASSIKSPMIVIEFCRPASSDSIRGS